MRFSQFLGPSSTAQSPIASLEKTVNFYVEQAESASAQSSRSLYPTPGFASFATTPIGPGRGAFYQNGRCFAVIGTKLFEISSAGVLTDRGTVALTDTSHATIAANGDGGAELFITASGLGYTFDLNTNTLTNPLASGANFGGMLDGFFLSLNTTTSTLRISALLDGATWSASQIVQRSAAPDLWKSMLVADRDIWLFGEETSELWYNAGTSPFPFALNATGPIPYGIAAPSSAANIGGTVLWLSRTANGQGRVMLGEGGNARRISTHALEFAFRGYSTLADAIGETYEDLGHQFYLLTFPTADVTWCYDLTTDTWCQRGTWVSNDNAYHAWSPCFHVFAFGKHLMVSRTDGTVWEMSTTLHDDTTGVPVRRVRRGPILAQENARLFFDYFELLIEPGLATAPDDPQITLYYSNDGGKTWTSAGDRSAGEQGEWSQRVRWNRQGSSRQRAWEIVMSGDAPYRLIDCFVGVRPGTALAA